MYDKELVGDNNIDAEEIFLVCDTHIPPLSKTIEKMISYLKE